MSIYNLHHIKISYILRVSSECPEGETIRYGAYTTQYELIYSLSGEHDVLFQNMIVHDSAGKIRYLPRGVENNVYEVKNIKSGECIDVFFSTDDPMPETMFSKDYSNNAELRNLFIKAHSLWMKKEPWYYNKCVSLFFDILAQMQKSDTLYHPRSHAETIAKGVEYIYSHYLDDPFDYHAPAALCSISRVYFNKLFREIYHTSPSEYVKNLKIQNACELISTGKFNVTQTAKMCGYENICYFSKVFKETVGVPPSEYIKRRSD